MLALLLKNCYNIFVSNKQQSVKNMQQQIKKLLANVSTTFANVNFTTTVKTAAAHKAVVIKKTTNANVQLFANIKAATSVFANAVNKNANTQNFVTSSNYFKHTNCYSIVQHKTNNNLYYLYAIFNAASSSYTINNVAATKQQVAQYLTASAANKLLNASSSTYNAKNNVTHSVTVRTIALHNINSITANKQTLTLA